MRSQTRQVEDSEKVLLICEVLLIEIKSNGPGRFFRVNAGKVFRMERVLPPF